ncbi:hypothetical protein SMD44_p10156 (plasmid) [Streptomyces alboflavus]|uniref:Lipoprotein n=1 Tax=Streptomyces alboflavus TaxID=67267 RepID=A0A291W3F2_9ACTN|nr:hypothetical protein [Streptomyces alboflavus]ATM24655.1 hypothetical protein SMD44_p10156 [Streptomyces alboflavus]
MRKAYLVGAVILAGTVLSGCGSDDSTPDPPSRGTQAGPQHSDKAPADKQDTVIERATGSWKTILRKTDIETLTIKDGQVSAKGSTLECKGSLKPSTQDGKEAPSLTFSSCKGSTDGGRGLGHLTLKDTKNDALAINWEGPKGGWGGPVDSFRRTG